MTDGATAEFIRELATAAEELQQAALSLERAAAGRPTGHGSDATAQVRRTGGETEKRRLERSVTENTRMLRDATAALRRLCDSIEKSLNGAAPFVVVGQ
jgi:hypothetical protein